MFSNDGLIYYTDDHYASLTQIKVTIEEPKTSVPELDPNVKLDEYGEYSSINEVSAFLLQFGTLPCNYITKSEAKELGWTAKKDNLGNVMPGCSIGGDEFQNREKLLPSAKGRTWYECDVNAVDGKRSDERLVFSSDGLIYYTPDAFETFIQLY
ncbi:MAG: ribonuclease [Clostridia bacterium]|nr:ribonuclease [Clostridia bacterium]